MSSDAGNSLDTDVVGTLQWNEFEGGFWSLDLASEHPELGARVVLSEFTPPSDVPQGSRVRARVRAREAQFGFQMAGAYVDVVELQPIDD
jgi:hypothetical protein